MIDRKAYNREWMRKKRAKIRKKKKLNRCPVCKKPCELKYCSPKHKRTMAARKHYEKYFKA